MSGPARDGPVMLGYVHNGWVRAEFMTAVLRLTGTPATNDLIGQICECTAGALVGVARNTLAGQFLHSPQEWLWMVDTDVTVTPGTLLRLMAAAHPVTRPILTGLVPYRSGDGWTAAIYDAHPGEHGETTFDSHPGWPDDTLIQVDGCGAACLLIHRSALETIRAAGHGYPCWFREIPGGRMAYGEDLSFCLRARDAGLPIWAHTGASCGHVKTVVIGKALP